jgi:hypothetical protein
MADFPDVLKVGVGCFFGVLFAALFFHVCTVFLVDSGFLPWIVSHIAAFFRRIFRRKAGTGV